MHKILSSIVRLTVRINSIIYTLFLRRIGIRLGGGLKIRGFPHIYSRKRNAITIGDNVTLLSSPLANTIGLNHKCIVRTLLPKSTITIGHNVGISGSTILSRVSIQVGDHTLIGANCTISDSDHHPIGAAERIVLSSKNIMSRPIIIERNVWLGMNVLVLKGVRIGENSIIAAGSVVSKSIPANVIAAGNPARVIRRLDSV